MEKKYTVSDHIAEIGKKVIAENDCFRHLNVPECRIAYQVTDIEKKSRNKIVYADTEKVKDKLKGIVPFDFIITFYGHSKLLSDEKLEKLMYHELKHVGYASGKFYLIPHDVEDFKEVIDKWGMSWL